MSVNAQNAAGDGNSGIVPFHEGVSGAPAISSDGHLLLDNQVSLEGRLSADGRFAVFLSTYDRGKPASRFYFNLFLHDLTKNQIKPLSEN